MSQPRAVLPARQDGVRGDHVGGRPCGRPQGGAVRRARECLPGPGSDQVHSPVGGLLAPGDGSGTVVVEQRYGGIGQLRDNVLQDRHAVGGRRRRGLGGRQRSG